MYLQYIQTVRWRYGKQHRYVLYQTDGMIWGFKLSKIDATVGLSARCNGQECLMGGNRGIRKVSLDLRLLHIRGPSEDKPSTGILPKNNLAKEIALRGVVGGMYVNLGHYKLRSNGELGEDTRYARGAPRCVACDAKFRLCQVEITRVSKVK